MIISSSLLLLVTNSNMEMGLFILTINFLLLLTNSGGEWLSFGTLLDYWSLSLSLLTLMVGCLVFITSSPNTTVQKISMVSILSAVCLFFTDSLLFFFLLFEFSVLPLLLLLLLYGSQAERTSSSFFFMLFTITSSAPLFLLVVIFSSTTGGSMMLSEFFDYFPNPLFNLSLISFMVKVPIYFFHSWLPKAHVESPLEGSMLLAGVMLKVGVYGFMRIMSILKMDPELVRGILSVCVVGMMMSALLSICSDDMKMSVALSSVSHMNFLMAGMMSLSSMGGKSAVMICVSHGISSPLLFYMVTKFYILSNSRSLIVNKGLGSKVPVLGFFSFALWALNMSAPPSLAFLGELMGVFSILSFHMYLAMFVVSFILLNSFFSILNYGVVNHSSSKILLNFYSSDFCFMLTVLVGIILSFILIYSGAMFFS